MDPELYLKITKWRDVVARREGVPAYRVISTQAVEGIVVSKPETEDELIAVKGIAEKKLAKYGEEILGIVRDHLGTPKGEKIFPDEAYLGVELPSKEERVFSVGDFLELLNIGLRSSRGKVKGEISSLDLRERYVFFGLKDAQDGSLMNVFMWENDYALSGVGLEEGMEVTVAGFPEIYKPSGRLTFRAQFVELAGEGALKKAYDELRKKLDAEGIFRDERKKPLPDYPERIGVITSKTGAVIHDFLNNIGKFGYKISFYDSRVEGVQAVRDLTLGVKHFKKKNNIDVLVVMRGGGSLESLQAFNNEPLIRELLDCPFPVIAGIGHDKDVPLFSLAADMLVSTPTAASKTLDRSWEVVLAKVALGEQKIISLFTRAILEKNISLTKTADVLKDGIASILENVRRLERVFESSVQKLGFSIKKLGQNIVRYQETIISGFQKRGKDARERIAGIEQTLRAHSPKRQLELGYSIAFSGGKVLRSVEDAKKGDDLEVRVLDGKIFSKIEKAESEAPRVKNKSRRKRGS